MFHEVVTSNEISPINEVRLFFRHRFTVKVLILRQNFFVKFCFWRSLQQSKFAHISEIQNYTCMYVAL